MELFDKDGNFVGEFIEKQKDDVSDAFSTSWALGILCFFWKPIPTIIVLLLWLIFKVIFSITKLCLKCAWWLIRLPFCLIFQKKWPKF